MRRLEYERCSVSLILSTRIHMARLLFLLAVFFLAQSQLKTEEGNLLGAQPKQKSASNLAAETALLFLFLVFHVDLHRYIVIARIRDRHCDLRIRVWGGASLLCGPVSLLGCFRSKSHLFLKFSTKDC